MERKAGVESSGGGSGGRSAGARPGADDAPGSPPGTDDPEPAPRTPGRRRRLLSIATTVVVLAIAVAVAARTVDLRAVLDAVGRADRWLLGAAVLVYAASWPVRGRRYGDVLSPMGHRLETGFLTLATFASQTANLVVPARAGDAARAYLLRDRRGVPYPTGAASLTVERAFDLLAIGVLGTAALGWLVATGAGPSLGSAAVRVEDALAVPRAGTAVAGLLAIVSVGVVGWLVVRWGGLPERVPDRLRSGVVTFGGDLAGIARRPRALAAVGAGSLAVWALDALTAVLVLAAVADVPVGAALAAGTLAVCAGNLAKVLPLTQGGLGLYEGAFAATVVAVSPVGTALALAAAIADHAVKNGVTVAGGGLAAVGFSRAAIGGSTAVLDSEHRPGGDGGSDARNAGTRNAGTRTADARDAGARSADD